MSMMSRFVLSFMVASSLFIAQPLPAAEATRSPLVTTQWLAEHRERADVLVLDASPPPMYAAGHIPGAVSASVMSYGGREMTAAEMERLFQAWGASPGKQIVLYDQGEPMWATRLFFDFHYHGFPLENLHVLDGGLSKWKETGGAVTKEATPAPPKGDFRVAPRKEEVRVKLPEFLTASGDTANNALVEALGPEWHYGETGFFDRPGHIPHGILLPSADLYNADKTFKSPAEIQRMLAHLGIRPGQRIHTYCGGGVAASVPYFAIRFLAGYPDVRLFVESELGWLQDERGLPFWTYGDPNLMRETGWLKTWGGRMMRMYGISKVSLIDVRPREEFAFGHAPFALNVPASEFRRHLNEPGKLAQILGAAGVKDSNEAVVMSGAGLDKDSALAYVALERLGQRKVSVFMDTLEKSVQAGFALPADAKKSPVDAIKPASYEAPLRKGVLIADPEETQGEYPRIYVASGKLLPARVPDGKVVHVPYADLLNTDGTPKAAKNIWKILAKAGVSRYAELVAVADDPGEAAANYFILKLMGFPDVKVMGL